MTTPSGLPDDPRWVDGSLESGADDDQPPQQQPGTGQGDGPPLGATVTEGTPTTFEPEEDVPPVES